jgi:hypothetical protein
MSAHEAPLAGAVARACNAEHLLADCMQRTPQQTAEN